MWGFMCGVLVLVFVWRPFVVERIMQITLLVERNSNDIDRFYKMLNGHILSIAFFFF